MVILNVMRGGPGVGGIQPGQADYRQATRGGGNGDYHIPVYGPASIQETVNIIYDAVTLADRYRNPVIILADGMLGQMMEPIILPEARETVTEEEIRIQKPWALLGHQDKKERTVVKSLRLQPDDLENHNNKMHEKYIEMMEELPQYESYRLEDAEVVFVSFGSMSRIVREAMDHLAEQGIKAGMIRPISLWPFPNKAFDEISPKTKMVISAELSIGQMMDDVKCAVCGRFPVELLYRTGGMVPTPLEVVEKTKALLEVTK